MKGSWLSEVRRLALRLVGKGQLAGQATFSEFKRSGLRDVSFRPVFVLSTGRCGTELLSRIIARDRDTRVDHSPRPELIQQGRIIYECVRSMEYRGASQDERDTFATVAAQVFLTARESVLFECYRRGATYVETNNRITFFAPYIRSLMPASQFVHLYRHPGEFIRSGLRRDWYSGRGPHEIGRPVPVADDPLRTDWDGFDRIEKIAWLWAETNKFIMGTFESLDSKSCYAYNFNALDAASMASLLGQLGVDVDPSSLSGLIRIPVNAQQHGDYPCYAKWPESDKAKVKRHCSTVADRLGFEL